MAFGELHEDVMPCCGALRYSCVSRALACHWIDLLLVECLSCGAVYDRAVDPVCGKWHGEDYGVVAYHERACVLSGIGDMGYGFQCSG